MWAVMHRSTNRHVWGMEEKIHCRCQRNALETIFHFLGYAINFGENASKNVVYFQHRPGPAVVPKVCLSVLTDASAQLRFVIVAPWHVAGCHVGSSGWPKGPKSTSQNG